MPAITIQLGALAAVVALGVASAATSFTDDESDHVVYAEFRDAGTILEGQDVKVHGVTVGRTGQPTLDPERKIASVPLHLDSSAFPVHTDATATVAPLTLLGERYVELDPGTASKPELEAGDHIAVSRTSLPVDLQDVVNDLDDPTASSLAAMVVTLGQGVGGNAAKVRETMRVLAPAMRDADALARVLSQQNDLLGGVVDSMGRVSAALAADEGTRMERLVAGTRQMLTATASQDQQLAETLRELPATLAQARKTLGRLAGTSTATGKVLANIRPATDSLVEISHELTAFADQADPALASADPVLEKASELLDLARPVAQELRRSGPGLRGSARGARPIVDDLNANLANVLSFIRYWALTTNGRDGLAHYFRAHFVVTPDSLTGLLPLETPSGTPDPGTQHEPRDRDDSAESGLNLPPVGGLLSSTTERGGVTGLAPAQELGALSFLLGGIR